MVIIRTIVLVLLLLTSCSTMKNADALKSTIQQSDDRSIMFLIFKITRDTVINKNSIVILQKSIVNGQFKGGGKSQDQYENYLTIEVYQKDSIVNTLLIEHPLFKRIEYLNDNNSFSAKSIILDSAEFFFRLQTSGIADKIKISESLKGLSKHALAVIKI